MTVGSTAAATGGRERGEDVGVRDRAIVIRAEVQLDGALSITWNDWSVRLHVRDLGRRRREEVPVESAVSMYMSSDDLSGGRGEVAQSGR